MNRAPELLGTRWSTHGSQWTDMLRGFFEPQELLQNLPMSRYLRETKQDQSRDQPTHLWPAYFLHPFLSWGEGGDGHQGRANSPQVVL